MDYKKINAPVNTVTRDMIDMSQDTGNVYETVCIIAKRANQISQEIKQDLTKKLKEFESMAQVAGDTPQEVKENPEQIEMSRYYERLPKPTLVATQEYIDHKLVHRNPVREKGSLD